MNNDNLSDLFDDIEQDFRFEEHDLGVKDFDVDVEAKVEENPYEAALDLTREKLTATFGADELAIGGEQVERQARQMAKDAFLEYNQDAAARGRPGIPMSVNAFVDQAISDMLGMGVLEPLLDDKSIEDIAINGPDEVMVYREGLWEQTDVRMRNPRALLERLNNAIAHNQRMVSELHPIVDATLPYHDERISIVHYPITTRWYPVAVIRAQRTHGIMLSDYMAYDGGRSKYYGEAVDSPLPDYTELDGSGMLSAEAAGYLHAAVLAGKNVCAIGPTGSGKTTMLMALARCIPQGERILIIEDTPEIVIHPNDTRPNNILYLRTRPATLEGTPPVTQANLVKLALRQRPDALTLGEARGKEIFDLLNALYTGHKNGLTSLHAYGADEMFNRILIMMAQSEEGRFLSRQYAARLVADTIHIVVTMEVRGRVRMIRSIVEATGKVLEGRDPTPEMEELFRFSGGRDGRLNGPLFQSRFAEEFAATGIPDVYYNPH